MRSTVPRELDGQRCSAGRGSLSIVGSRNGLPVDDGSVGRWIGTGVATTHVQDAGIFCNATFGYVRFDQNIVIGPT